MMHFTDGSLENGIVRPQTYQPEPGLQVEFLLILNVMSYGFVANFVRFPAVQKL